MTVSGLMVSQRALESSHGLMVVVMKVNGSRANQLARALRRIKTERPNEESGKVECLSLLVMLKKEKIRTCKKLQSQ